MKILHELPWPTKYCYLTTAGFTNGPDPHDQGLESQKVWMDANSLQTAGGQTTLCVVLVNGVLWYVFHVIGLLLQDEGG